MTDAWLLPQWRMWALLPCFCSEAVFVFLRVSFVEREICNHADFFGGGTRGDAATERSSKEIELKRGITFFSMRLFYEGMKQTSQWKLDESLFVRQPSASKVHHLAAKPVVDYSFIQWTYSPFTEWNYEDEYFSLVFRLSLAASILIGNYK